MKKGGNCVEQKNALTINETAKAYNFPAFAIRTLVKRQAFPVIQVGNRCYTLFENGHLSGVFTAAIDRVPALAQA